MALLSEVPEEVLEYITSYIASPRDLTNFASTRKWIAAILVPRHTQYRVIRAPLHSMRLWTTLTENASLARNVRKLSIIHDYDSRVGRAPPSARIPSNVSRLSYTGRNIAMQEEYLIKALHNMRHLVSFTWETTTRPAGGIWATLETCPDLCKVDVFEPKLAQSYSSPKIVSSHTGPMFALSNLTSFTYESYALISTIPVRQLFEMLSTRCPNLSTLSLTLGCGADGLLEKAVWPHLRRLRLMNTKSTDFIADYFLKRHPDIEELIVDLNFGAICGSDEDSMMFESANEAESDPGVLPRLRRLVAPTNIATGIISTSTPSPRELNVIQGIVAEPNLIQELIPTFAPKLTRLDLSVLSHITDLELVAKSLPSLTWLSVYNGVPGEELKRQSDEVLTVLELFPSLIAFHGIPFVFSSPNSWIADVRYHLADPLLPHHFDESFRNTCGQVATMLHSACPTLRRVDGWHNLYHSQRNYYFEVVAEGRSDQVQWSFREEDAWETW